MNNDLSIHQAIGNNSVQNLRAAIMNEFKNSWFESVHNPVGPSGRDGNKLRTYALFKTVFEAEMYCKKLLPLHHRAAFAKFRCGVAPLCTETGRFDNKPLEERKCPFCDNIESEKHVLLDCNMYNDLRHELFSRATIIEPYFDIFSAENKIRFFLSNHDMINIVAKTCFNILINMLKKHFR